MTNIMNNTAPDTFRDRLQQDSIVVAPGVYDALSASLAEQAGFDTVYLSGASLAYTKLGRPDIGLMSLSEVNDTLAHIRERSDISIVEIGRASCRERGQSAVGTGAVE